MKKIAGLIFIALFLTGCGLHQFKADDGLVQLEMHKDATRTACYQALAMNGPDYSKLSDMAIVMIEQQKATAQLVGALTGKAIDPCGSGTNLNDVLIVDSTNRNRSLQSLGGGALKLGGIVAGVWGATEIVDSIGKNAGSTSNVDTGGGDSSVSNSRTNTETTTESTALNNGEEGSASTSPAGEGITIDEPVTVDDTVSSEPVTVTAD